MNFSFKYDNKVFNQKDLESINKISVKKEGYVETTEDFVLEDLKIKRITKTFNKTSEWAVTYFENIGKNNTKQIADIWDADIIDKDDNSPVPGFGVWGNESHTQLHMTIGCTNQDNEYNRKIEPISPFGNEYKNTGARSSCGLMPYFELRNEEKQVVSLLAVGWTGEWHVFFDKTKDKNYTIIKCGVDNVDFYLKPGEKIRTASALYVHGIGKSCDLHNEFRRIVRDYLSIGAKNKRKPQNILALWGGRTSADLLDDLERIRKAELKFDRTHIDAMWFGNLPASKYVWDCKWFPEIGTFEMNYKTHPNGLKDVREAALKVSERFGSWYEFERAAEENANPINNPDLFYPETYNNSKLLKLCDEKAQKYALDLWEKKFDLFEDVDLDFNFDPLTILYSYDEENRKGLTHIKHFNGLYKVFDTWLSKHPDSTINNCASGGRRLDLEMVMRTESYHVTDRTCSPDPWPDKISAGTCALFDWIPVFTMTNTGKYDEVYKDRSFHAPAKSIYFIEKPSAKDLKKFKERYEEYNSVRDLYIKDYYPIFGYDPASTSWGGWQFNDTEKGKGMIMAFRHKQSPSNSVCVELGGLDKKAKYEFYNVDTKEKKVLRGIDAIKGYEIFIEKKCDSRLITYKKI